MGLKNNKNRYVFCFMVGLILLAGVPVARAGWLDFLDPRVKEEGPDPKRTLMAPFADQDAVLDELDPTGNKELAQPLDQRHRPNTVIAQWVQMIVPALVTYNSGDYEQEYAEKIKSFSKVGAEEYVAFLQSKSIIKTLKTGRYNVSGIVQDYPIVINEGPVDGRYRWLMQVNVLVTYLDGNMTRYSRAQEGDTITQEFVLTMQLGRVRGADNEHGLLIETWNVKDAE